jgi:GxxExxY protein
MEPRATALSVSHDIVTAAMKVHSILGPGLLESAYEACHAHELRCMGHTCETQVALPVVHGSVRLDIGYRIDILVGYLVIVKVKAVERVIDVHYAQVISYLKLSNRDLGLLINFHVKHLKHGLKRFVRETKWKDSEETLGNPKNPFVILCDLRG